MRKVMWNNKTPDVEILYKKKGDKVIKGEKTLEIISDGKEET